jgi:hypothetical protein
MTFSSKVVGSTFCGGQKHIANCRVGEDLTLVREPQNIYDKNAIRIETKEGNMLGHIPGNSPFHLPL